jgi:DNA primase
MVLRLLTPYVCSSQNESLSSFGEAAVEKIKCSSSEVYTAFDSDEPGVKASWELTKKFGFRHVNVPYNYLDEGIKDFADLAKYHGLSKVRDHLKQKHVI